MGDDNFLLAFCWCGFAAIYHRNVTLRAAVIRGSYYSGLLGHCTLSYAGLLMEASLITEP